MSLAVYDANNSGEGGALINSPQLTDQLVPRQRAVRDFDQCRRVVKNIITFNRQRMIINSRITAKINSEKPLQDFRLKAEGLGWKSNFTSKPLSQMNERAYPRFSSAIKALKYLTNSELPPHIPGASYKTNVFRRKLTEMIRKKRGWNNFLDLLAQENTLFGYTVAGWTDPYRLLPDHYRQDEFFIPQGTKQDAESAQLIVLKETLLPHELFEKISNRENAEYAGWLIDKTVEAINKAVPTPNMTRHGEYYRQYEDMRRELNTSFGFEGSPAVIEIYNVFAREIDGKVSHYRVAGPDLIEIFKKEDRFASMKDCAAFFSYQQGNGTMHGSKGIGREIYELAGIIDRNRNEVVDRLNLSGKTLIQTEDKNVKKFRMSVVGNAILISRGFTVLEQKIDANVEPFMQLDAYLGLLVDQLIGSVSPRQLQGERVTKAQVDLFAQREEEMKDSKISRFIEQFVSMMGTIQKRALDPETTDDDAKQLQKELLEVMTREEIDLLRDSPVAGTVMDLTPMERQQIIVAAQENLNNPLYNQRALQEEKLIAQLGHDFADKVLLPDEDPTIVAEQTRLQQLELGLLWTGQGVPVSPRDGHEVHLGILMTMIDGLGPAIHDGQASTQQLEVIVQHSMEHYNYAIQQGADKNSLAPIKQKLNQLLKVIDKLKQLDEQAASVGAAGQALQQQSASEDEMAAQSMRVAATPDTMRT